MVREAKSTRGASGGRDTGQSAMKAAVHHVTVVSGRAGRLIEVLQRALDFPVAARFQVSREQVGALLNLEAGEGVAEITLLGDGPLGLIEVVDVAPRDPVGTPTSGLVQLSVAVPDLRAALRRLEEAGCDELHGPEALSPMGVPVLVGSARLDDVRIQLTEQVTVEQK